MEIHQQKTCFIIVALLALTSLSLFLLGDIRMTGEAGVREELPSQIGDWQGEPLRYCSGEHCLRVFPIGELVNQALCPHCGSALGNASPAEQQVLPADTTVIRKLYRRPDGHTLTATIVLMGSDRTSIHRPEACLPGQGFRIIGRQPVAMPRRSGGQEEFMMLDLEFDAPGHPRATPSLEMTYAYWFIGKDRETAHRMRMQLWMAADRLFKNKVDRWAYVSVITTRSSDPASDNAILTRFLGLLRDKILLKAHAR